MIGFIVLELHYILVPKFVNFSQTSVYFKTQEIFSCKVLPESI